MSAAFRPNWWARAGWVALAVYVVYAASRLEFTWARFVAGLDNGARFLGRMFPPVVAQPDTLVSGLVESLEIAILASFLGIVLALPVGLAAARNLMPAWATWPARALIASTRAACRAISSSVATTRGRGPAGKDAECSAPVLCSLASIRSSLSSARVALVISKSPGTKSNL